MTGENRESRIVNNIALVHSVANRFRGRGAEYEDLFQAGCVGLVKAADRFDESLGYQFSTYAVPVIMGEIRRLFRDGCSIKVSRALKEKSVTVQKERERFIKKEMREPTVSELCSICRMTAEEMTEILGVLTPTLSIDEAAEEGGRGTELPYDDSEKVIDRLTVALLLTQLTPDERRLVYLRFFEDRTQTQTAKALNISQVQVSRREKALLTKMRKMLS